MTAPSTKKLIDILDGDIPDDVAHWIVDFHDEIDERNLTPLQVAERAFREIERTRRCTVTHVRSGLMWHVDLRKGEVFEIVRVLPKANLEEPRR
jgi:hypothetical protein